MARRNLVDIDNKIIEAVIKIGSAEGIKNITSKKVATMCGISHFTCFEHFGTRQGMLDAAANKIEKDYLSNLTAFLTTENNIIDVWDKILDSFISDPDSAMYYYYYYKEMECELTLNTERGLFLLSFAKKVLVNTSAKSDLDYLLLWDHVIETAFYYTEKIIKGLIPNTKEVRDYIAKIVFNGVLGE